MSDSFFRHGTLHNIYRLLADPEHPRISMDRRVYEAVIFLSMILFSGSMSLLLLAYVKVYFSGDRVDEEWQYVAMFSGMLLFSWFWGSYHVVTSGKVRRLRVCTCLCCCGATQNSNGWMEKSGWGHDLENGAGMFKENLKRL